MLPNALTLLTILTSLLCNPFSQPVEAVSTCSLSDQNCGIRGRIRFDYEENDYLDEYNYYYEIPVYDRSEPARVANIEECAALCSRRRYSKQHNQTLAKSPKYAWLETGWCRSFYFYEETGFCQLGFYNTTISVVTDNRSPYVFYDLSCFECPALCAQTPGVQLLDNGGFENDILGPWASKYATIRKPGRNSKKSWRCNAAEFPNCGLWQVFNQCEGETYSLSFDYKVNAQDLFQASLGTYSVFEEQRQFTEFDFGRGTNQTAVWRRATIFHKATPVHGGAIFTMSKGSLDNVKVTRIDPDISIEPGSQALDNSGFQSGQLTPWSVSKRRNEIDNTGSSIIRGGKYSVVKPGIESTRGLQYVYNKTADGYSSDSFRLLQSLGMNPVGGYRLSFDYNAQGKTPFSARVSVISPDLTTNSTTHFQLLPGSHSYSALVAVNTPNSLFSLDFTLPSVNRAEILFDNFNMVQLADS